VKFKYLVDAPCGSDDYKIF